MESLRLHDTLHDRRPAKLTGDEYAGRIRNAVRDNDLLDLVTKRILDSFAQILKLLGLVLANLLLVLRLLKFKALFAPAYALLPINSLS